MIGGRAARELAERQEALMRAATGGAEAAGFDPTQVQRFAASLLAKRERTVARAWPFLTGALGIRYPHLFAEFAAAQGLAPGGPAADGRLFARWLKQREKLGEEAELEVAWFDTRFRLTASGEVRKRRWGVCLVKRNGKRRLLVSFFGWGT